jgi:hypothetical protein
MTAFQLLGAVNEIDLPHLVDGGHGSRQSKSSFSSSYFCVGDEILRSKRSLEEWQSLDKPFPVDFQDGNCQPLVGYVWRFRTDHLVPHRN